MDMEFEENFRLGIIGCGNMGEAIARGAVSAGAVFTGDIYVYDILKEKSRYLKENLNVNVVNTSEELATTCNAIILSVKPQDIEELLKGVCHLFDSSKLIISIAAGISISKIKSFLNEEVRVIRVMPNMAALENQSISALSYDERATAEDKKLVRTIFKSIGDVMEVKEYHMDAVTAVSGSGPAYFFYLAELLEKCAIDMGIDEDKARLLAVKTATGSAALLRDSGFSAETLRKRVASKGGTTEAAFKVFQDKGLGEIIKAGIIAAKERAKEISGGS